MPVHIPLFFPLVGMENAPPQVPYFVPHAPSLRLGVMAGKICRLPASSTAAYGSTVRRPAKWRTEHRDLLWLTVLCGCKPPRRTSKPVERAPVIMDTTPGPLRWFRCSVTIVTIRPLQRGREEGSSRTGGHAEVGGTMGAPISAARRVTGGGHRGKKCGCR